MSSRDIKLIKCMIFSSLILFIIIISFCVCRNIMDNKNKEIARNIKISEKRLNDIRDKNKLLEDEYKKLNDEKDKVKRYNDELKEKINE